jgi:hypothetical protein
MPSRPDLRDLASNVRDAFAELDRETLLDVLTFVLKEYVVEGPPPMLVHQAETLADLRGATFAQLISALQTRFDFPELAMFVVDGDTVSVRVGAVMQPLVAGRQPLAADLPRPAAGVRVVETTLPQRPAAPAQPPAAPPPARGVSVRGRPSGEAPEPAAQPPAAQPAPAQPAPAATDKPADKPEGGDDASARFSLLELD